jgi:hypothetical protein
MKAIGLGTRKGVVKARATVTSEVWRGNKDSRVRKRRLGYCCFGR